MQESTRDDRRALTARLIVVRDQNYLATSESFGILWRPARFGAAGVGGRRKTVFTQRLDVPLTLHHEYDWRFEHFRETVENLPLTFPPCPSATTVWTPLFESFG